MDSVIRGAAVYIFLMIVFRIAGKRALAETTTFDLVLLLIISEATQQAMVDSDNSMTNAFILIVTLIGIDILMGGLACRFRGLGKVLENVPLVIVEDGKVLKDRTDKSHVNESDILAAARETQGLKSLDEIKYAVLERNGEISIIPKQQT